MQGRKKFKGMYTSRHMVYCILKMNEIHIPSSSRLYLDLHHI